MKRPTAQSHPPQVNRKNCQQCLRVKLSVESLCSLLKAWSSITSTEKHKRIGSKSSSKGNSYSSRSNNNTNRGSTNMKYLVDELVFKKLETNK
jgi:hypothetical protein